MQEYRDINLSVFKRDLLSSRVLNESEGSDDQLVEAISKMSDVPQTITLLVFKNHYLTTDVRTLPFVNSNLAA